MPSLDEARTARQRAEAEYDEAVARGASEPELRMLRYHGLNFARRTEAEIASGTPRTAMPASVHAIRIGDGAIVTAPGEIFAEIGMAVRERSPADVTLYAGYTNGCVSYIPAASEYPLGGTSPRTATRPTGCPPRCRRSRTGYSWRPGRGSCDPCSRARDARRRRRLARDRRASRSAAVAPAGAPFRRPALSAVSPGGAR